MLVFGDARNRLFGRRQTVPLLLLVLAALVEGMGIRAADRMFGLDSNTMQQWLGAAAEQLNAFAAHFLVELKPEQVQLDELHAPLAQVLETESNREEFRRRSSWVWTAMDPVSKLIACQCSSPMVWLIIRRPS